MAGAADLVDHAVELLDGDAAAHGQPPRARRSRARRSRNCSTRSPSTKPRQGAVPRSLSNARHAAWSSPPTPFTTPAQAVLHTRSFRLQGLCGPHYTHFYVHIANNTPEARGCVCWPKAARRGLGQVQQGGLVSRKLSTGAQQKGVPTLQLRPNPTFTLGGT